MSARIVVIDDHQIIRDGLRLLLHDQPGMTLVGHAYNATTGWEMIEDLKPDLVLMDLDMPGEGGVKLTRRIVEKYPDVKVLVLTGHTEAFHVRAALDSGAKGYVLKGNGIRVLVEAINTVLSGKTYLCPDVSEIVVRHLQSGSAGAYLHPGALSSRETEVLTQIANGFSTKEIASNLGVSAKTVETHRMHLMSKLKAQSVVDLTKHALREGLASL